MRRVVVILAVVALAVTLIAGGAVAYFLFGFDARAEITRACTEATGRACRIGGPVSVSLYPNIGFKAADMSIANVGGADGDAGRAPALVSAREVVVGVALAPLFDRKARISSLLLVEPRIALEVDAAGAPNWILAPQPRRTTAPTAPTPEVREVSLGDVRLIDGAVTYANAKTKTTYALEKVTLTATLSGFEAPLRLEGSAVYAGDRAELGLSIARFRSVLEGKPVPLTFTLAAPRLNARFEGQFDTVSGGLAGEVKVNGPSLRRLAAWAGPGLGEGPGLGPFSVEGRVRAAPKQVSFENAAIAIDAIKGRGDFLLETGRAVPAVSGRLEVFELDLNPYLVAAPKDAAAGGPVATIEAVDISQPGWSEAEMDFSGLRGVNANLELVTGALLFHKMRVDRSRMMVVLNGGYLAANLSEMELYGGRGRGRFELDARGPVLGLKNELDVAGVRAERLLADAIGFTNIEGEARVAFSVAGRGASQKAIVRTLVGAGRMSLAQGALRGVNLGGVARTIRDAVTGGMIGPQARTNFKDFSASFRAVDGLAAVSDLRLEAPEASVAALGTIDLAERSLDMRITPRSENALSRIGGPFRGLGLAVPFRVSGPFSKLTYTSDVLGRARPGIEAKVADVLRRAPQPLPQAAP